MALRVKTPQIATARTTAGTQDITKPGETTSPIACEVWCSGATGPGLAGIEAHARISVGFYDGTTQVCHSAGTEDGIAGSISDTWRGRYTNRVIHLHNKTNRNTAAIATVSFITGGIRLNWTNPPSDAVGITVTLWFGDGQASVDTFNTNSTLDASTTVAPGFKPDYVHFASSSLTGTGNFNHFRAMYGVAHRLANDGITQFSITSHDEDNSPEVTNNQGAGSVATNRCIRAVDIDLDSGPPIEYVGGTKVSGELTDWTATGFEITTRDIGATLGVTALSIKHDTPQPHGLIAGEQRTTTGTQAYDTYALGEGKTGISATADAINVVAHFVDPDDYGPSERNDNFTRWSRGTGDAGQEASAGFMFTSAAATTDTKSLAKNKAVFLANFAETSEISAEIDSFSDGSLTLDYTDIIGSSTKGIFIEWFTEDLLVFTITSGTANLPTLTATGNLDQIFSLSGTPSLPTLSASGTLTQTHTLSGTGTLPTLTASGTVTQTFTLSGTANLPTLSASGTLVQGFTLSGTGTLPTLSASGTLSQLFSLSGTGTLPTLEASGVLNNQDTVTLSGEGILPTLEASGTLTQTFSLSGTANLPTLSASGTLQLTFTLSGTGTLPVLSATGVVAQRFLLSGSATLPTLTASGTLTQSFTLTGTGNLPTLQATGAMLQIFTLSGAGTLPTLEASGTINNQDDFTLSGEGILPTLQASGVLVQTFVISTGAANLPTLQAAGTILQGMAAAECIKVLSASFVETTTLQASYVDSATLQASYIDSATLQASYVDSITLQASYVDSVSLKASICD